MKSNSYIPSDGLYYRFDVRAKIIFSLLMIVAVFFVPSVLELYVLFLLVLFLSFTQVGIRQSVHSLRLIAGMLAIMIVFMPLGSRDGQPLLTAGDFMIVSCEAFENFLVIAGRFLFISLLCSLLMQTSRADDVMLASLLCSLLMQTSRADDVMLALSWFRLPPSGVLVLSLAMRFIPDLTFTFNQVRESQSLRKPDPDEDAGGSSLKSIRPAVLSVLLYAVRCIPMSAGAIDLRGYGRKNARTHYKKLISSPLRLFTHFFLALTIRGCDMSEKLSAVRIAVLAVSTALVTVFTLVVRVPLGTGYLNLCDVAISFVAYTFGPVTALVAGGLGPAIADLSGGYAQWAAVSLVVHGLEGLFMSLVLKHVASRNLAKALAAIICIVIVPAGYYLLSGAFLTGFEASLADIPGNLLQSTAGAVFGLVLSEAIVKAYPPVKKFAW